MTLATTTRQTTRRLGALLAGSLAAACAGATDAPAPDVAAQSAADATEALLPEEQLQALVDGLPDELRVPGVVLGVSKDGQHWVGAAGTDDTTTGTPMLSDRQFRIASITKMFTAVIVMGLVEEGELSLDDVVADWFPSFPNADEITVGMLLSHTGGVTTDWWQQPDIAQLALDDLGRVWTPTEVLDVTVDREPAGPPGSPTAYSNTGFILLAEIAAAVTGHPIDVLIDRRIISPLGLHSTVYGFENAPRLAHAYYDLDGQTLDMTALPMQALPSMAGAAGAMQSDAPDLLTFLDALLGSDQLLDRGTAEMMRSEADGRFRLGLMGFCPCGDEDGWSGWGHTGDIPGFFSAAAHFPDRGVSVVVFMNRDIVDGQTFHHDHLDGVVERVVDAVSRS